jgi:nucleotide-binding universal stress UspA family protein
LQRLFSDPATPAVQAALSEASRREEDLDIIHAVNFVPYVIAQDGMTSGMLPMNFTETMHRASQERLDSFVAQVLAKRGILADGPPADAILDASVSVPEDLIVVETYRRSGLSRLALGSVAEAVVRGAFCSVLVVWLNF